MKCLGVIPARFPSSRLPGKPLKDIAGKTLLQRVWEQATAAKTLSQVVIATDDQRIFDAAKGFGAEVLMTSAEARTGSDRVAEVAALLDAKGERFDAVANVQGDMPFIRPGVIDQVVNTLLNAPATFGMATVGTPIMDEEEYLRPSAVKVVLGNEGRALYFSRAPIPHMREVSSVTEDEPYAYKHLGLYVFRPDTLRALSTMEQTLAERRESLEQLRALCNGIAIKVAVVTRADLEPSIEVDTPDDLERARKAALTFVA